MTQPNQPQEPIYSWDVKLADSLRKPVTIIALETNKKIQQIVTEAVIEYIKKQNPNVGE